MDFPGGPVVKNPPARDTGLISDPGGSHMLWGNLACEPQLVSPRSRVTEPHLLNPCAVSTEARVSRAHALQQEKPSQ